jgi:hypothetical protein
LKNYKFEATFLKLDLSIGLRKVKNAPSNTKQETYE